MINPELFYKKLQSNGINTFYGVPDSLLKDFCAYVDDHGKPTEHIITANEGNAIAIATGYHISTGKVSAVYMQNSGLGNAINPLTSLADSAVYKIPILLIIGWRGEPNVKDEPQHIKQGEITPKQLELLGIPYWMLDKTTDLDVTLNVVLEKIRNTNSPVALLVKKDAFSEYKSKRKSDSVYSLNREDALRILLDFAADYLVVSTTGKTSREVFEIRSEKGQVQRDFLTVGGMGHTSSIALGVAIGQPSRKVLCLDGDGSLLMHMGAMPIIGHLSPPNYVHVLLNNSSHESVGGQPTVADNINLELIAKSSGYKHYYLATNQDELNDAWKNLIDNEGPIFLEIKISKGSRSNLGRPTSSPEQNKLTFMKEIGL
jgi:phosphonopyruvate decarboxylase